MNKRIQILADTDQVELGGTHIVEPQRVAASRFGMVATAHHCATDAGKEILAAGGNAIDAAISAALALGVCEPAASGIGGQTMMLIHTTEPRRTFALDGSSRAPNRATVEVLRDHRFRLRGHTATTVPSSLATYDYVLREYGTMKFARVVRPAMRLAEEGFPVSALKNRLAKRELKDLRAGTAATLFLRDGTRPYTIGSVFRQPILAKTLRRLAKNGINDFYQGQIARQIHRNMEQHGGLLNRDDLAQIPQPIERQPVSCHFDGHRVISFPPPGAGRTLVEMLNILGHFPLEFYTPDTPDGAVVLAEVIRRAFFDRRDRPYDPAFYAHINDRHMLNADYAKQIARQIRKQVKTHGDTTHVSVMDRSGNVVGLTQSIERVYGSCAASPELGFLYNNYMSAFEYEDMSHPYYLRPNAVPWASVAPTIVFRGRRPWAVLGSPGSDRITPSIMQVLLRLKHQPPYDAVAGPRIHCRLDGEVSLEAARMRDDIPPALRRFGFTVRVRDPYSFFLGCVQLVTYENGTFVGVADPRRDGSAAGPDR
jgi:gamma-glutamyltranspeptidase/glutathione hydrolase